MEMMVELVVDLQEVVLPSSMSWQRDDSQAISLADPNYNQYQAAGSAPRYFDEA